MSAENAFFSRSKMIIKYQCALIFVCVHMVFVTETAAGSRDKISKIKKSNEYEIIGEKKILFTGHTGQYVEFNVSIPYLLDFAMCLWYKPELILNQNVLFSYGSVDRQLIMWKIKKIRGQLTLILKLHDTVVMEQNIKSLKIGQWYHLCQYWKGSTGLWAIFLNNYILSYGYTELKSNCLIHTLNATATLNHPRTKNTLHGGIYGFHLMSIDGPTNTSENQGTENFVHQHKSNFSLILNITQPTFDRPKRQTTTSTQIPPMSPSPPPPFFRIRNFLRLIRRVIRMVALPVIRFAQGLVMPWRRKFTTSTPTTTPTMPAPNATSTVPTTRAPQTTTPLNIKPVTETLLNSTEEVQIKTTPMFIPIDLTSLEEEIVIYESELEPHERRGLREVKRSSIDLSRDSGSSETYNNSEETNENVRSKTEKDKCEIIEQIFTSEIANYDTNKADNGSDDAITHLGAYLHLIQLLYSCCYIGHDDVLISWMHTSAHIRKAANERVAGCGNF